MVNSSRPTLAWLALLTGLIVGAGGCSQLTTHRGQGPEEPALVPHGPIAGGAPTEMDKVSLPPYVAEPPDILLINAVKLVPKHPYHVEPLDVLQILVVGTSPEQPIAGPYVIDPSGTIDLGPGYGKLHVTGMTVEEISQAITEQLAQILNQVQVSVTLAQVAGQQDVAGEHLVGPDGRVNLGIYGQVRVAGLTLPQIKQAIQRQLSAKLEDPEVSVDVLAFNSKSYYIITEGAGFGDLIVRVPVTGNETVLDALAQVQGRTRLQSKRIWIARPAPGGVGCDQILPVDWDQIVKGAATKTNYQILPGDHIFLAEDRLVALDTMLSKIVAPLERVFGFGLLGSQSVQTMNLFPRGGRTSF